MERVRRLDDLWNWLPAFRAVAETEHLPTASRALFVSPSALSRTIKLLEEAVGRPLFDRVGRRIVLAEAGHDFLSHVRDAMRLVDEGLQRLEGRQLAGAVHISVPGPLAAIFVLPALSELASDHPDIVAHLTARPSPLIGELLRQGHIDVALLDDPLPAEDVLIEPLATVQHGAWCHPSHPLAARSGGLTLEDVADHPFVAPAADARGVTADRWPLHVPRRITIRVTHMQVAVDAVIDGGLVAVLPDPVAERHRLHRLPVEVAPATTVHLAQRTPLPVPSRISVVVEALREVAAAREIAHIPQRSREAEAAEIVREGP